MKEDRNVPKFDNSFWNEEIGNFQGWESVLRRLKDGRQILKEYSEFLKQRAAIEEHLGKSLVKLAKTLVIREELDPLRYVWEILKAETENSGLSHLKSAHQLMAEATKVNELNENYREKRRIREEVVRGHQQNLKIQWKRVCDAKRMYEGRCREEVATNQFYHQEVSRVGKNSREAEKAHSKYVKTRQALDFCESVYQSSVSAVEETRVGWEKETERTFLSFQCIEEERLSNVRDSLWKVSNIISATSVDDDRSAEEVRKALEACDLDEAVAKFISNNSTGENRPEPIVFKQQPTSSSLGLGRAAAAASSNDDTFQFQQNKQKQSYDSHSIRLQLQPTSPLPMLQQQQQYQQINFGRSQTPFHQYMKTTQTSAIVPTSSVSLSSLHEFVRANTNNYNRALNLAYQQASCDPNGSRTNSQISLATSPDVLQTAPAATKITSPSHTTPHHPSFGPPQPQPHPHPPARPRKPPRLLQYANMTFQSTLSSMNRSRSCSPEKPIRIIDTVENTEYFNLPDDSGTPPSSDYQSDISCSGGEQTNGGDSGIYSLASPPDRLPSLVQPPRPPSPVRRMSANHNSLSRPNSSKVGINNIDKSWNNLGHAVVLCDFKKTTPTEITLGKSQIVQILDSKPGADWWRVRDDLGREGYYPALFLKMI